MGNENDTSELARGSQFNGGHGKSSGKSSEEEEERMVWWRCGCGL